MSCVVTVCHILMSHVCFLAPQHILSVPAFFFFPVFNSLHGEFQGT